MRSADILAQAAKLIGGDRQKTHGDKRRNYENVARSWTAFMQGRENPLAPLTAEEASLMMALLKISRTQSGSKNPDDYIDGAGYMAIAGELSQNA